MKRLFPLAIACAATLLAGCAGPRLKLPAPVESPAVQAPQAEADEVLIAEQAPPRAESLQRGATPSPPVNGVQVAGQAIGDHLPPMRGGPVNVNIEGVPVPAFIDEFFGTALGVGYQMEPAVAKMNDLVTLRTSGPQSPENFYRLAVQVLQTYGVATRYENGRVFFTRSTKGSAFEPPLVLSGRALPSVPITHRPVFQLVQLKAVRLGDVIRWLNTAFETEDLKVIEDLNRNAVVLYGKPDLVRQAADAIEVFDQPFMRGRLSTRLEPAFVTADELARRLVDVLGAEGYAAALQNGQGVPQGSSILALPIPTANTVLLFAADQAILEHAVEWAQTIDRPNPTAGGAGLFYYRVQNTKAEDIAKTLNGVRSGAPPMQQTPANQPSAGTPAAAVAAVTAGAAALPSEGNLSGGKLVLDEPRNALIFQGSSADWGRLLPLIKQMDKAARQVMIEVTIAEVTLDDNQEFGVSWLARNDVGRFNGLVTSGVLGGSNGDDSSGGTGLTYLLDVAGQARAQLRAFAEDNRVAVLSTPRLLVKSGEEASIDVGTEVPTITSQTASIQQTEGNSNLLQSVQYRKTGIILHIKPVVYSDNRIDLEISQEVSEALPLGANAAVQSPSIFNRAVSTSLSLHDGSSVLIGGLMSNRTNSSDGGVPFLKDIPLVGSLFKTQGTGHTKTELVLMIVPYIVESDEQAASLTRSIRSRYQLLDIPTEPVPVAVPMAEPATTSGLPSDGSN